MWGGQGSHVLTEATPSPFNLLVYIRALKHRERQRERKWKMGGVDRKKGERQKKRVSEMIGR